MKKLLFLVLAIAIIGSMLMIGCGTKTTSTTAAPTTTKTTAVTTTAAATTTPAPTTQSPQRGGTLRILWQTGISNLSLVAKQGMTDESLAKAYSETLVYYGGNGDFMPELAKSWDIDTTAKTLTFHLQQGVKFQDGTDFNADAVKWNVQNLINAKRLANGDKVVSIEAVDPYTFRYNLNQMMTPSMMLHSYGYDLLTMFSPTAYLTAGGTIASGSDDAASQKWATSHFVTTGAFKFDSWQQDVTLKIVKNSNYWRGPDFPYLDAIVYTFVADTSIAKAKMLAGEADIWGGPALKEATDLQKSGFNLNVGVGGFYNDIIPNNVSDGSPFKDQKVRAAVEYAIDRDALVAAFGYGVPQIQPVTQCGGPPSSQGYDPNFKVRAYNVATAKDLLKQAGYPNGFTTKMMIFTASAQDLATAIQANLADAGITVEIDVADPGRYIGSLYQGGWEGLLLWSCPIDPEFTLGWFVHFGRHAIFPYPSLTWPDEYWAAVDKTASAPTVTDMRAATVQMMDIVSNGAYIIPLFNTLNMNVATKKVHTQMGKEHFMTYHNYMDWIEK